MWYLLIFLAHAPMDAHLTVTNSLEHCQAVEKVMINIAKDVATDAKFKCIFVK